MQSLLRYIDFVNEQLQFNERMAEKHSEDQFRRDKYLQRVQDFSQLKSDLIEADRLLGQASIRPSPKPRLSLVPSDLEGLPKELLEQLSLTESDLQEMEIFNLIESAGGSMSIDQILIGVYRSKGEILDRGKLTAKLYRMAQKELIFSIPGKKGAYSISRVEDESQKV